MVATGLFDGDKQLGSGVQDPGRELEPERWSAMQGWGEPESEVGGHLCAWLGGLREEVWQSLRLSLHFLLQHTSPWSA